MYDVDTLGTYLREGEHYIINGQPYHANVIFECETCTAGLVCLWKHQYKKRTFMLMCGVHTTCGQE